MTFHNGGKVKEKLHPIGKAPRGRTGTTVAFWPDPEIFNSEGTEFRAQTILEHLQTYAFLNKGLEIKFVDERKDHKQEQTYKYAGGIVDFVKYLNETKEPLFRKVCDFEMKETEQEVEIALQWNIELLRGHPLLRQRHRDRRRRYARRGLQESPDQRRQPLRAREGPPQGEGRQPPGRGHPRGIDRRSFRSSARTAVRGTDEGQARQRIDPVARRARDQRAARVLARGEPTRGTQGSDQVAHRLTCAAGRQGSARPHPPEVGAGRRRYAGQAPRLRVRNIGRGRRAVHHRGRFGRWYRDPSA